VKAVRVRVVAVLALVEAGRLVRNPALAVGAVLTFALSEVGAWQTLPSWPIVLSTLTTSTAYLAAAAVLAGQLATARQRRRAMAETLAVLPTSPHQRSLGLLGGLVGAAGFTFGLVVLFLALQWAWPAGRPNWYEVVLVVVLPVLGGAVGIAFGHWLPRAMLAVVAAGVVLSPIFGGGLFFVYGVGGGIGWLSPVVPDFSFVTGLPGPSGWHLLYVIALVVFAASVALLRDRPRLRTLGVSVVAVAVAAGTFLVQVRTPSPYDAVANAAANNNTVAVADNCERHGDITYCAYPGYRSWITHWRGAVEPVAAAVPASARGTLPMVRQTTLYVSPRPNNGGVREAYASMWWGSGARAVDFRAYLATSYASAIVGLPAGSVAVSPMDGAYAPCTLDGQARVVVALWLAAQSLPDGASRLRDHRLQLLFVEPDDRASTIVTALLAQPRERVTAALARDWDRLTAPDTPVEAVAELGVPVAAKRPPDPAPPPGSVPPELDPVNLRPCHD
jgi:hypothetical protein